MILNSFTWLYSMENTRGNSTVGVTELRHFKEIWQTFDIYSTGSVSHKHLKTIVQAVGECQHCQYCPHYTANTANTTANTSYTAPCCLHYCQHCLQHCSSSRCTLLTSSAHTAYTAATTHTAHCSKYCHLPHYLPCNGQVSRLVGRKFQIFGSERCRQRSPQCQDQTRGKSHFEICF